MSSLQKQVFFDYFYGGESELISYYRIPRLLVTGAQFKDLSTDAKLLYGLLLDRMSLSAKNGWYDSNGRVYIYYPLDEVESDLCCGHGKAVRLMAELDSGTGIGLIEHVRQGLGKPSIIYVKQFTSRQLALGLYLVVETKVPEMVTSTVNPFFVSLPMTTVSGDADSASPEGGHGWNYDVVVYPKNETGIPTLEKSVREAKGDTGKNNGSDVITDGFAHNATGSAGDIMEYQIITTLPRITSQATALSVYNFFDTLSAGLSYNKEAEDVKLEFFTDKDCTEKVATWTQADGKFTVTYSADDRTMTIDTSKTGLAEINGNTANNNGILYASYSNYTLRVTYTAKINSDNTFVYGDSGNDTKVVLTWKRSNSSYYDTLIDDAHVYSYGIDLTKLFSDKTSENAETLNMFAHVKFKVYNNTDKYWVTAELNEEEGVYYVTGHEEAEDDATAFVPVTSGEDFGKVIIKGLEDDEYVVTEIETANGYTLLKDAIVVTISVADNEEDPCDIYSEDVLGVLQNDPRYAFDGGLDLHLANIPQKQLAHNLLTASATVDGNKVEMKEDDGSLNAEAQLSVMNHKGFDLPQSGEFGMWMFTVTGILFMAGAGMGIVLSFRRKTQK